MSTAAPEYLTTLRDGFADAVQQWLDQSTIAWDQWSQAWSPAVAAAGLRMPGAPGPAPRHRSAGGHHHRGQGCGCRDGRGGREGCGCQDGGGCREGCGCGDVCDCCVPEADVIVRARAGEVRVVPFRLHNPWRRERTVTLEVGPWHGCSGDDPQLKAVLEATEVVLGPCEDRVVRLRIATRGTSDDGGASTKDGQDRKGADATRRTPDVDSCLSAYADVRFEGCARPQRVAVVVLPAECDAVDVGCDCGCCC